MKMTIKKIIHNAHIKKINRNTNNKSVKILKMTDGKNISDEIYKSYIELWRWSKLTPDKNFLKAMNRISGIVSSEYVPENIHYSIIEPILNNREFASAYNDKNFFERFLPKHQDLFPYAVLRGVNNSFLNKNFDYLNKNRVENLLRAQANFSEFVIKPATETGGGGNVNIVMKKKDMFLLNDIEYTVSSFVDEILIKKYGFNFIMQERLKGLKWFEDFNPTSVNTVRMYVYRSVRDNAIHPLHAYIRFGSNGSIVDSSSQGGMTCGIQMQGILNSFAIDKYGTKINNISSLNDKWGNEVPRFEEMKKIAVNIAGEFHHHRLLGFDFLVDSNNMVRLFEVNNLYIGIINQQMNSGPLFGSYIDEVIEYCRKNKISESFHFYI